MIAWRGHDASAVSLRLRPRTYLLGMRIRAEVLLAVWVPAGVLLASVGALAWIQAAEVRRVIESIQALYGAGRDPAPWLRADAHIHALVAFLAALWVGVGCRMFAPRALPWLPVGLVLLVAWSDEVAQLAAADRTFQVHDLVAEGLGVALAVPLLFLLRRIEVVRSAPAR